MAGDPRIAGCVTLGVAMVAGQRGVDEARLQASLGRYRTALWDPEVRVPVSHVRRLVEEVARRDSLAPQAAAVGAACEQLGLCGFLLLTAPTAEAWLAKLERNGALVSEWGKWSWARRSDGIYIVFDTADTSLADRILVEVAILSCVGMLRDALPRCAIHSVLLRHRAPTGRALHPTLLDCPIEFSASENAVRVTDELVGLAPRLANASLFGYLDAQAEQAFERIQLDQRRPEEPALLSALRHQVAASLAVGAPSMMALAETLGMSERTLRRRLEELGYSYRQLVEELRVEEARRLLETTTKSVSEVAREVGYAEASSLSRTFRRGLERSPREFLPRPRVRR